MIETLSGTTPSTLLERSTMKGPSRSTVASTAIGIGGSIGITPRPCHAPINGSNSCIGGPFGVRVEPLHDLEALEDDERVVVDRERRVIELRPQVVDVGVPEALVRHAELVGVGISLAL